MKSIQDAVLRLLAFLKIVDPHDGCVSLTSVGLMVVLAKVGLSQAASVADLGALMGTLLLYGYKKQLNGASVAKADELSSLVQHTIDATRRLEALEGVAKTTSDKIVQLDNRTQAVNRAGR